VKNQKQSTTPITVACFQFLAALTFTYSSHCQTPEAFKADTDSTVTTTTIQPDGKIFVGGNFGFLAGQARQAIGRLNPDGSLDTGFNPGVTLTNTASFVNVNVISIDTNNDIFLGGVFDHVSGQARASVAKLNSAGMLDSSFHPEVERTGSSSQAGISSIVFQENGQILIAGGFNSVYNQPRTNLARINQDGSLDLQFNPNALGISVSAVALQPDGRILIGGLFTNVAQHVCTNLARLNPDGSWDTNFNASADAGVGVLALQRDGTILAGGLFSKLCGVSQAFVGKLFSDGSLDSSFNPHPDSYVFSIVPQVDGKVLLTGAFTNVSLQHNESICRLATSGSVDPTFVAPTFRIVSTTRQGSINCAVIQADAEIIAGGNFWWVSSLSRTNLVRLTGAGTNSQSLNVHGATITWLRSGTAPELLRATFEFSQNGRDWSALGNGVAIPGGWESTGVSIPPGAVIRARGYINQRSRSWFVEAFSAATIALAGDSFGIHSNQFTFSVQANLGQTVVIDSCTDLNNWVPVVTNTIGLSPFNFSAPYSSSIEQRLYRVRIP